MSQAANLPCDLSERRYMTLRKSEGKFQNLKTKTLKPKRKR